MQLLADESADMAVVRALRLAGHDVRSIAEEFAGTPDENVAQLAQADRRILLTEDRDFGRLFYAQLQASQGVIYMRYPAKTRQQPALDVVKLVDTIGPALAGAFVVMQPGRTRVSRLPAP